MYYKSIGYVIARSVSNYTPLMTGSIVQAVTKKDV